MEIDKKLMQLLLGIGSLALQKGYLTEAEVIYEAVAQFRPQNAISQIGKAQVAMGRRDFEAAVTILSNAPYIDIEDREIRDAFLGMALKLAGYSSNAQRILGDIKENGTSDVAIAMACKVMDTDFSSLIK